MDGTHLYNLPFGEEQEAGLFGGLPACFVLHSKVITVKPQIMKSDKIYRLLFFASLLLYSTVVTLVLV